MRISVDMIQANKELDAARRAMGLTLRDLMYDQARLLAQDAVRQVPPGPKGGTAQQKEAGTKAVVRDIRKIFWGTEDSAAVESWVGRLDDAGYDIYTITKRGIKKLKKQNVVRSASESEMKRIHDSYRTRKGRVRFRHDPTQLAAGKYGVPRKDLERYIRSRVKKVGNLKAGFVPAADHFAGLGNTTAKAIPAWVRKQTNRDGSFVNAINAMTGEGFAEVINMVPYSERAISKSLVAAMEHKRQSDIERQAIKRLRRVAKAHNDKYSRAA